MNIIIQRIKSRLYLFILIGIFFFPIKSHPVDPLLQSVNIFHKSTSIIKFPAAISVLYAHATSNEKLENLFKVLESLNQILNGSNTTLISSSSTEDRTYLDIAWLGVECFRSTKYIKKYVDLIKQEQINETLSNEQNKNDEIKPKNLSFKIKIAVCAILAALETYSSFVSYDNTNFHNLNIRNLGMSIRGLRYFLLSESSSLEAKISITMTFLSLFEFIILEAWPKQKRMTLARYLPKTIKMLKNEREILLRLKKSSQNHIKENLKEAKENGLDPLILDEIKTYFTNISPENILNTEIKEKCPYEEIVKAKINIDQSNKNYDGIILEFRILKGLEGNLITNKSAISSYEESLNRLNDCLKTRF